MFICRGCNDSVGPRISRILVPIKTRPASYPFRKDANHRKIGGKLDKKPDKGGQGYETVKEIALCPDCLTRREEKEQQ
jgi:hypothetical protein